MRVLKNKAIYKHFKGQYYATMGASKPISLDEIHKYCKNNNTNAFNILKFESKLTEFEEYKGIHIFEINNEWYHIKEDCNVELILYKSLYDNTTSYARPIHMFLSEVDKEKYPNVEQYYRFEEVEANHYDRDNIAQMIFKRLDSVFGLEMYLYEEEINYKEFIFEIKDVLSDLL